MNLIKKKMVKKDKELLLKDLCERLPYGVICHYTHKFIDTEIGDGEIRSIYVKDCLETDFSGIVINQTETGLGYIKPYLRPMSSMAEEEKLHVELTYGFFYHDGVLDNVHIFEAGGTYDRDGNYEPPYEYRQEKHVTIEKVLDFIHWLNVHHFDYRGLIEKGLALEANEGMYD